jgi:BirA family transcriptional regulator, biotin operon repressor / biotin---[acetyl-CoA-carboxylase] ligase
LPYRATFDTIGQPFILLTTVDSTNNYAMAQAHAGLATPGTAYFALDQTAGKGQRGRIWRTVPGKNIIMSLVLDPGGLSLRSGFLLSASVALGCYDFYKTFAGDETSIKWPNDLYWRDRKAGGILIENQVGKPDNSWLHAIAGIGININQTIFDDASARAVSLKQITGVENEVTALAKMLCVKVEARLRDLYERRFETILDNYNHALFKCNQKVKLRNGAIVFETTIKGVDDQGNLLVRDTIDRSFGFGEVSWIFD